MRYWDKPKDVPVIRFSQLQRSSSQVLLSNRGAEIWRKKDNRKHQCRGSWKKKQKKTARCMVCRNSTCAWEGAGVWKLCEEKLEESRRLCSSLLPSLCICVRVVWSGHSSPMRDLALSSDAPPPVASVPSLQVTLTAPLMHIHYCSDMAF